MKQFNLNQAWVSRITSDTSDNVIFSGKDIGPLPSATEIDAIINKVAGGDAAREMSRRKWFVSFANDEKRATRGDALKNFLLTHISCRPVSAGAALFRRQLRQRGLLEDLTTLAWLYRIADMAATTEAPQFDVTKLQPETIKNLVRLSNRSSGPRDAISYLKKLGIRVVLESSLPGMRTDGASFIAPNVGPVIGLTLTYDRLDSFWFTLLHELAHITLHLSRDPEGVFVDSTEEEDIADSEVEAEANAFAKDSFVPRDAWLRSDAFRFGTEPAIIALAKKFEIHPAIVAGRLRFERRKYKSFHHLLGAGQVRSALMVE